MAEFATQTDEQTLELLRLSNNPVLLNAFINRVETSKARLRTLTQSGSTVPFLGIQTIVGARNVEDRFKVEPLRPISVRPEAFSPLEEGEHPEFCVHDSFAIQDGSAPIYLFGIVIAVCLLAVCL